MVLADVCMPDLDGYELAAMIRQHPRCQKTSIIFVSAVMMAEPDRLRGYQSGAVDYVPVPVVPEILRAKVKVFAELYRKTRALEELNAELERRVAARTAELEATTAALREADRRKDEFLAMLAHELRNPLAPIRTAVQLLRLKELPEAHSARARDTIDRQVEHLVCLIDDLLDVSRITRGMITLQREPVPASAIVARAIEITRPAIDAKRHELILDLADEPLTIEGDRTRLVQIIGNILHNATKFMEPGGRIVLRVDARRRVGRRSPSRTTASASPPIASTACSTCSRRSTAPATAPRAGSASGWRWCAGWSRCTAARSPPAARGRAAAPRSACACRWRRRRAAGRRAAARRRSTPSRCRRRRAAASSSPTTTATPPDRWRCGSSWPATTSAPPRTGSRRSPSPARSSRRSCCSISGMPAMDGYETARHLRRLAWGKQARLIALTGWGQQQDRLRTAEAGFDVHLVKPVSELDLFRAIAASESSARTIAG